MDTTSSIWSLYVSTVKLHGPFGISLAWAEGPLLMHLVWGLAGQRFFSDNLEPASEPPAFRCLLLGGQELPTARSHTAPYGSYCFDLIMPEICLRILLEVI